MNRLELAETLIAIADNGAIHKAATKLHQTNAAISKKLSKLEAHLGVQLITRDRKGLSLTEAGQRYYHEAKNAIKTFQDAELAVVETKEKPRGELKIITGQYFAKTFILPKIADFKKLYPDLKLLFDIAEVQPDFNAKKMDILFGSSMMGDEHLVRKMISSTQYVLCASPEYLKHHGIPHAACALLKHDYITHSGRKRPDLILCDKDQEIIVPPKYCFNNSWLTVEAALQHLGFIWTHCYMVSHHLKDKKLVSFLEKQTQNSFPIYAYYEYQRYRDPKIKVFMDFFTEVE